ncbi:MAG: LbtU family siderophore porin [Gammaproteobacteria bacterium]
MRRPTDSLTPAAMGLLLAISTTPVHADPEQTVRLYRTREEQREVGVQRRIASWLTSSALAEIEWQAEDFDLREGARGERNRGFDEGLQWGLVATPLAFAQIELLLDYDGDAGDAEIDEALFAVEAGDLELEIGQLYLPFGAYYSRFVSGPLVEFGETRATAAVVSYAPNDRVDFSLAAYRGRAREQSSDSGRLDWTFAMEVLPWRTLALGCSVQSDLADADSRPLADDSNRYSRKVPGVSAYFSWLGEHLDFSFEVLAATRSYRELDADRDRPVAWNLEVAYRIVPRFGLALRLEGSDELEDAPHRQYGIAGSWLIHRNASLTLEYLHGEFAGALAANDRDEIYDAVEHVGALLSIAY